MLETKLRVGFLCEGPVIEKWQALCLEHLSAVENVEIILIFSDGERRSVQSINDRKKQIAQRLLKFSSSKTRLWSLYYRFLIAPKVSYFKPVSIAQYLERYPYFYVNPSRNSKNIFSFEGESIEKIKSLNLDILLKFSLGILRGEILNTPKYGVWSYHHGDEEKYRGLPPGFWETYHKDTKCGLVLQRITEKLDSGFILQKGYVPTSTRSYAKTLEQLYSIGHRWPAKLCREILRNGALSEKKESKTSAKIFKAPRDHQIISYVFKIIFRNFVYLSYSSLFSERWTIGVVHCSMQQFLSRPLSDFQPIWLPSFSKSKFEADPFGYQDSRGQWRIMFESYNYRTGLGKICSAAYDKEKKSFSDIRTAIEKPFHLSYPFTFKYNNETYCVVESFTESSITYYKLTTEGHWQPHKKNPMPTHVHDLTLLEHEGSWYLLYTFGRFGSNASLHILCSDNPFGPFKEHPQNPVKIDIRSSRGAGAPFKLNNSLYRPSQNSELEYGNRLAINRLKKLSPTEFEEETVVELSPPREWGNFSGIHTLSTLGDDMILIDCKTNEWLWYNIYKITYSRIKRTLSRFF